MRSELKIAFLLLVLTGCQSEETIIEEPPAGEVVSPMSNTATLISQVALKDGSFDNIIDQSACTSVALPVTVIVNGAEIEINSEEDFTVIESIFDEFEEDEDELNIVYPVTIIFPDYSQMIITNEDELDELRDKCEVEDDDIECLDFQYPISFSVYDVNTQAADVIVIDTDQNLFLFLEDLDEGDLVGFNFPLTLVLYDGTQIIVSNNTELEDTIEDFADDCDEEDDKDIGEENIEEENDPVIEEKILEISNILMSSTWRITLFSDTTDETSQFQAYQFSFNGDSLLLVNDGSETFEGEWEVDDIGGTQDFTLEIEIDADDPPLVRLNEDWAIVSYASTRIELRAESEIEGFEKRLIIEVI